MNRSLSAVAAFLVFAPLAAASAQQAGSPAPSASLAPLKVIDVAFMNRKANACVDFNEFANGAWLATDTIPAAYSSSGVSRDMSDRNELVVRSVLDDAMSRRGTLPATSTERKLGTYYATCMDSAGA